MGEQGAHPCPQERYEVALGPRPHIPHRLENTSAPGGHGLVVFTQRPPLVIVEAWSAEYGVRVAVDEAGEEDARHLHHLPTPLHVASRKPQVLVPTDRRDSVPFDQDGGVVQHFDLGQLGAPARPRRAATGDDLARANEQRAQSPAPPSRIGSRIPCRRAAASASGYPASAWRATPRPGSFVRTRSSRRAADGDPSATLTCPACSEFPMPTPPP